MALKDFKQFVLRGNVVDLAVGVVVGAAFSSVVNSFVRDILTPFLSVLVRRPDFSNLAFSIGRNRFLVGDFLNSVVYFLNIAAAVYFFVVAPLNAFFVKSKRESAPATKKCPECLSDVPAEAKRCAHCTSHL